jgi:hypothetical protein
VRERTALAMLAAITVVNVWRIVILRRMLAAQMGTDVDIARSRPGA